MRTFTTQATLIMSIPEGINDAQVFQMLNQVVNPFGVDFVYPSFPGRDNPAVIVRVLKLEEPKV